MYARSASGVVGAACATPCSAPSSRSVAGRTEPSRWQCSSAFGSVPSSARSTACSRAACSSARAGCRSGPAVVAVASVERSVERSVTRSRSRRRRRIGGATRRVGSVDGTRVRRGAGVDGEAAAVGDDARAARDRVGHRVVVCAQEIEHGRAAGDRRRRARSTKTRSVARQRRGLAHGPVRDVADAHLGRRAHRLRQLPQVGDERVEVDDARCRASRCAFCERVSPSPPVTRKSFDRDGVALLVVDRSAVAVERRGRAAARRRCASCRRSSRESADVPARRPRAHQRLEVRLQVARRAPSARTACCRTAAPRTACRRSPCRPAGRCGCRRCS